MATEADIIAIVNLSKRLKAEDVLAMIDAVSRQQAEDVCPIWKVPHRPINLFSDVSQLPPAVTDIGVIMDEPGDPGTLGWHSQGIAPFGRVFVSPILDDGGCVLADFNDPQRLSVASVFSHEFGIELPVDPGCDQYALDGDGNEWDLEAGDPCQRNQYLKTAEMPWGPVQVAVSDFVTPLWFAPGATGRFNYLHDEFPMDGPFKIAPGGYAMKNGDPTYARRSDGTVILPPAAYMAMRPPGARRRRKGHVVRRLWTP
jgi:hypothetical protein